MIIEDSIKEKVSWFFENDQKNMGTNLGIKFLKISKNEMIAEMPVDERTVQPSGSYMVEPRLRWQKLCVRSERG